MRTRNVLLASALLTIAPIWGVVSCPAAVESAAGEGIAVQASFWVPSQEILESFDRLIAEVGAFENLSLRQRNSLLAKLRSARANYTRSGQGCSAAGVLQALLNEMAGLRRLAAEVPLLQEDFYNRVRLLRLNLIETLPRKSCSSQPRLNAPPRAKLQVSNAQRLQSYFTFGEPRMWTVEAGKPPETFTQLEIPGLESFVGEPGEPGIPLLRRLVAIPREATNVRVTETHVVSETLKVHLYPFQPQGMDADIQRPLWELNPPFTINRDIYASPGPFPALVATVNPGGSVRDLKIWQLSVAAGQYYPSTDILKLFKQVNVKIYYDLPATSKAAAPKAAVAPRTFLTSASLNPFESDALGLATGSVLNAAIVGKYVGGMTVGPLCTGAEFLIMTHPDFLDAATTLASWKRTSGLSTAILEVGAGTEDDTAAEIDARIESFYDQCLIRPSYVLLLGDAEFIPPFYKATGGSWRTGTDYYYALLGDPAVTGDKLPDFAVGRIPVDTLEQANAVVNKIIQYERNPPHEPTVPGATDFYRSAAIAGYFQCCRDGGDPGRDARAFIETSELVRNEMVARGKSVDRIYVSNTAHTGHTGDDTPRRYYNGTTLPAAIAPGSGFDWFSTDGQMTAAINAAIGDGRFLVMHRGHGGWDQWEDPFYLNTHAEALTNGRLAPVVFSVNCASGYFDPETTIPPDGYDAVDPSLVEAFLRNPDGGAVGVLGDSRNSPTWANNAMTRGFFDAIWPNTVPDFGDATAKPRLGDILNHAKLYLMTQVGVGGTTPTVSAADADDELYLWHCYGDPTMKIWRSEPFRLSVAYSKYVLSSNFLTLHYAIDGAVITAYQEDGEDGIMPIGRGTVRKGQAIIGYVNPPDPDKELIFYASGADAEGAVLAPALVLDQSNWDKPYGAQGCNLRERKLRSPGKLVQTFTPSLPTLAALDLYLQAGASFPAAGYRATVQILDARGALRGSATALLLRPLRGSAIRARFSFARPLKLTPGKPYSIRLLAPDQGILSWYMDGSYGPGTAYDCGGMMISDQTDYLFKTYGLEP